jgi:hypothetical protein
MANTVINLINLDFNKFKESLKTYAKEQALFKDYDFDGSNMSVLNDLLSYNTYQNSFYLNMLFSEMFLDSAQLRNSIASHTKDLNYVPTSFRSARIPVDIAIDTGNTALTGVTIPKNQPFSTRVNERTFQFVTAENIVIPTGNEGVFIASGVDLFEGSYIVDTFYSNYALDRQRFVLSDPTIDTTSLTVVVADEISAKTYRLASSFLDLGSEDEVFFLQAAENDKYEIVFGNNIIGKRPKNGSSIYAEYRVCNGELPNGALELISDRSISTFGNVTVRNTYDSEGNFIRASGGAVHESLDDIKFNAPRHYQTQERAITANDYKVLLKKQFPEINALAVYGGESLSPPQYGRVFVAVDLFGFDGIPEYKKNEFSKWLKNRMPITVESVFIDPTFTWGDLNMTVRYDQNKTDLTESDISTRVLNTVQQYSANKFNDFNITVHFSKLMTEIDNTHPSILSTEAEFRLYKLFKPTLNIEKDYVLEFSLPLKNTLPKLSVVNSMSAEKTVSSSNFTYNGRQCRLEDDNAGTLRIVTNSSNKTMSVVKNIGKVDYDKGTIAILNFAIPSYSGNGIKLYVKPRSSEVDFALSDYFEVKTEDVNITIIGTRKE